MNTEDDEFRRIELEAKRRAAQDDDENDDWSEWVCPDPKGYLMKCCDCGLVHEAEFGVVRYKSETEREDCDIVSDPNVQAVFRMRRSEQWTPKDTAHRAGGMPMAQPEQVDCVGWFGYDTSLRLWFETNKGDDGAIPLYKDLQKRSWAGLMLGVRVKGDTVVMSVKGGNDNARLLCGELLQEKGK